MNAGVPARGFLRDVLRRNADQRDFRLFGPDETGASRLSAVFDVTDRTWMQPGWRPTII